MVHVTALPETALLQTYASRPECYTDCFGAHVSGDVSLEQFISAFYSTRLFWLERVILKYSFKRPSTKADIAGLAAAQTDSFAAWNVEARAADQLLMCDMSGRTRSWLMVRTQGAGSDVLFGSAVVRPPGRDGSGFAFKSLLGFHNLYARALLWGVVRTL